MKKWIALLLLVAIAMSTAACGRKKAASLEGTMGQNVGKIMRDNPVEFAGSMTELDLQDTSEEGLWLLKGFTGLDSGDELTDAAVYEPLTGSQAFSLVLVRVKETADAKAVAQKMKDNIDPRKWICVGADQVMAAGYGDAVMLIMVDSALGKTAQSYVDTFANLCGGKLDFTI